MLVKVYMVSELRFAGGLGFEPLPPPNILTIRMDTKAIYAPKMGARDPLSTQKWAFE